MRAPPVDTTPLPPLGRVLPSLQHIHLDWCGVTDEDITSIAIVYVLYVDRYRIQAVVPQICLYFDRADVRI